MPTPTAEFEANPVKFADSNLIIVRYSGPPQLTSFRLVPCTSATAKRWYGKKVPVYDLMKVDDLAADSIRAYWLPYNNDAQYQIEVGVDAVFMFTPTMDGCTFAVGGRDGGAVSVAHLNYQKEVPAPKGHGTNKVIDQQKIDDELTAIYENGGVYVLRKKKYKSKEGDQVTTWGFRTQGGWSFYYQKRQKTGSKFVDMPGKTVFQGIEYDTVNKVGVEQFTFLGNNTGIKRV